MPFELSDPPSDAIEASAGSETAAVSGSGVANGLLADNGLSGVPDPRAALHVLPKAQAAAAAVAFNVAYEEENDTPSYDRLRIAPLRLGSGLAASALPVSTAPLPFATPSKCSSALVTHGSLAAASGLLAAAGPTALAHQASTGLVGAGEGQGGGQPQKRRRLDGDDAGGGDAAGGTFTLPPEFAFVLNRCFNCGSYGHDLGICKRPRNQTIISTRQREWLEGRGAVAAQRRRAQRAAAAAAQRRGPRHKASHGRYFSGAAPGEEEAEAAQPDALVAGSTPADAYDPTQALTCAPPGVRPGVLSAALAAALGLKCPLDPPPWLVGMALHGIPPAYCRGPYVPMATETEPEAVAKPSAAEAAGERSATEAAPPPPPAAAFCARSVDGAEGSAGVALGAGTATGGQPDLELLRPLLPDAPCHVQYAGLNAPLVEAACRDRWRVALSGARRVAAFVVAVRGALLRREQRLQQQHQEQAAQAALCGQQQEGPRPEGRGQPGCPDGQSPPQQHQPQLLEAKYPAQGLSGHWQQQQQQGATAMCWQQQQQPQPQPRWQQQQQPCWQQQHQQQLMWRQAQLQMQQQCQFMAQQQQQRPQQQGWPAPQGIPFFFGGPNFQGHGGQGPAFPGL